MVFLLLGLLLGAAAAGGADVAMVRAALGTSGACPVAIALPVALMLLRQRLPTFPSGDLRLLLPAWRPAKVELPRKGPCVGGVRFVEILPRAVAEADGRLIR